MSVTYDAEIMRKYAQKLYNQANLLIILLLILGAGAGAVAAEQIGAVLGGLLGAIIGAALAFKYKLQAQITLCQVQIEENTRRAARGT